MAEVFHGAQLSSDMQTLQVIRMNSVQLTHQIVAQWAWARSWGVRGLAPDALLGTPTEQEISKTGFQGPAIEVGVKALEPRGRKSEEASGENSFDITSQAGKGRQGCEQKQWHGRP